MTPSLGTLSSTPGTFPMLPPFSPPLQLTSPFIPQLSLLFSPQFSLIFLEIQSFLSPKSLLLPSLLLPSLVLISLAILSLVILSLVNYWFGF
jgi:hypothetical protein